MTWFDKPPMRGAHSARLDALEKRERELYELLLDYIRSDMAAPWMASAKRLEAFLDRPLRGFDK